MTPEEALALVDYHAWATYRLLDAVALLPQPAFVREIPSSFPSVRDTLAHLHGADEVWLERWTHRLPTGLPPAERFPDCAAARAAWDALLPRQRAFVATLGADGLARTLTYRAFNGQQATVAYAHMLQHVVNHGSYHRGQVSTMLRQLGAAAPKGMDMIVWHRERGA